MMHKVEIWENYHFGGWTLSFMKEIELPFVPFYGLVINDHTDDHEHDIELVTHDYCRTRIDWSLQKQKFSVDVRHVWKHPVRDDVVDEVLEIHKEWTRNDRTNVDDLKSLMNRNYEISLGNLYS